MDTVDTHKVVDIRVCVAGVTLDPSRGGTFEDERSTKL